MHTCTHDILEILIKMLMNSFQSILVAEISCHVKDVILNYLLEEFIPFTEIVLIAFII